MNRHPWVVIGAVWALYPALLLFTLVLVEPGTPVFFPAAGLTLVGFLLVRRRLWPVLAVGIVAIEVAVDLAFGLSLPAAVMIGCANVVEPALAALLISHFRMDRRLVTLRDRFVLFTAGAVSVTVSSLLGATGIAAVDGLSDFLPTAARWWASDWLGQVTVAPALLALLTLRPRRPSIGRLLEGAGAAIALAGLTYAGFGTSAHGFGFALGLVLVVIAFRFGHRGVAAAGVGSAFFAVVAAVASSQSFVADGLDDSLMLLGTYLGVAMVAAHLLAASLQEKDQLRHQVDTQARAFEALFEGSPVPLIELGADDGLVRRWNPAAERMFGWRATEVIGRPSPIVPPGNGDERDAIRASGDASSSGSTFETTRLRRDGTLLEVITSAATLQPTGDEAPTIVAAVTDVTERKQLEAQLRHAANHDALTGLVNRSHAFEQLVELSKGNPDEPLALLFLDLDGFKEINDTHGHPVGDDVLCVVAARVRAGAGPAAVVARWGGDEFLVVTPTTAHETGALSESLARSIQRPIELPDVTVGVGVSIGIALHHPAATAHDLLRSADANMRALKRSRRRAQALRLAEASQN